MRQSPKLPASTVAKPYYFKATSKFWDVIQSHTGLLDRASKRIFRKAIDEYVFWEQHSENAQPVADAQRRLADFRVKAAAFWNLLNSPTTEAHEPDVSINLSLGQQTFYVHQLLNADGARRKAVPPLSAPDGDKIQVKLSLNLFAELMTLFVIACDAAEKELSEAKNENFYESGQNWNLFVARLATFYESIGKRATARKHTYTHKRGDVYSPFVAFVHLVQLQLPARFCQHPKGQHTKSVQSELNSAVAKALAARRNAGLKTPAAP